MSWWRATREQLARRSIVTDEPFAVAPELLGLPLATVRRRGVAFTIDLLMAFVGGVLVLAAASVLMLRVQAPTAYEALRVRVSGASVGESRWQQAQLEIYRLIDRRRPDLLPSVIAEAVDSDDARRLAAVLSAERIGLNLNLGDSQPSTYDAQARVLQIRNDVTFGPFASGFSFLAFALLYFTLFTRAANGRTPGKWLLRLRARRLDGRGLDWSSAFARAGGYASSTSTLGLGFLAAVRDPNRQALHDRIAGTVVVLEGRSLRQWLRSRSSPPAASAGAAREG